MTGLSPSSFILPQVTCTTSLWEVSNKIFQAILHIRTHKYHGLLLGASLRFSHTFSLSCLTSQTNQRQLGHTATTPPTQQLQSMGGSYDEGHHKTSFTHGTQGINGMS